MLRACSFAFVLMCVSAAVAVGDEESHRAAIEELLIVTKTPENMKASIDTMLDLQIKQAPVLGQVREPMRKFFEKHLAFEVLKDDLIKIYAAEFTEAEVRDLVKFYQTPLGKKTAEKMPILTAKGAQLGASKVDANKAELQEMIRAELLKPRTLPEKKP